MFLCCSVSCNHYYYKKKTQQLLGMELQENQEDESTVDEILI